MLKKTTKTRTNVVQLLRTQSQDSDTCISGFCDPEELSQPERDFSCIDDSINFLNVCDFFVSPKFCDKKLRRMTKMTCYFFSFSTSQFLVSLHKPTLVYRGKKTNLFFLLMFFFILSLTQQAEPQKQCTKPAMWNNSIFLIIAYTPVDTFIIFESYEPWVK